MSYDPAKIMSSIVRSENVSVTGILLSFELTDI
jgi:hypothetical protein